MANDEFEEREAVSPNSAFIIYHSSFLKGGTARSMVARCFSSICRLQNQRKETHHHLPLSRNHSFNTICSAILIDRLAGPPGPDDDLALPCMGNLRYDPPPVALPTEGPSATAWKGFEVAVDPANTDPALRRLQLLVLRDGVSAGLSEAELAGWRWRLRVWSASDREQFKGTLAAAWNAHVELNPQLARLKQPGAARKP